MAADGSRKAVIAACAANAGIGVAKLVGFFLTGAASMLAEAVHSAADSGNQALLLFGSSRATREPSQAHPFGYGRERYFWAFIVAVVIFMLGSVFAIYEGVNKLIHPHPIESPWIAVGILLFGVVLETVSFYTAIKEARRIKGSLSWREFLTKTKQAELPVVLLEDLGALVGLVFALAGVGLAQLTGNSRFDAMGSIAIGLLLGVIAIFLALEMHSLLIGESAEPIHERKIAEAINQAMGVKALLHIRTMHLGPDQVLVGAKVEFEPTLSFQAVAEEIDRVEKAIRAVVPLRAMIYLEPALEGAESGEAADPPTPEQLGESAL